MLQVQVADCFPGWDVPINTSLSVASCWKWLAQQIVSNQQAVELSYRSSKCQSLLTPTESQPHWKDVSTPSSLLPEMWLLCTGREVRSGLPAPCRAHCVPEKGNFSSRIGEIHFDKVQIHLLVSATELTQLLTQ